MSNPADCPAWPDKPQNRLRRPRYPTDDALMAPWLHSPRGARDSFTSSFSCCGEPGCTDACTELRRQVTTNSVRLDEVDGIMVASSHDSCNCRRRGRSRRARGDTQHAIGCAPAVCKEQRTGGCAVVHTTGSHHVKG